MFWYHFGEQIDHLYTIYHVLYHFSTIYIPGVACRTTTILVKFVKSSAPVHVVGRTPELPQEWVADRFVVARNQAVAWDLDWGYQPTPMGIDIIYIDIYIYDVLYVKLLKWGYKPAMWTFTWIFTVICNRLDMIFACAWKWGYP